MFQLARVTPPEEFFGFKVGDDRKLARWDRIVEYFKLVASQSDRVLVEEIGKTTEGNPFIVAYISSPENLSRLDELRKISCALANPDTSLSQEEVDRLAEAGKAVVVVTNSMHSTEVGGTQMSIELLYKLATSSEHEVLEVLREVVTILIPSQNPDGQIAVVDWYSKTLGTEYEGTGLPWLYHKYCGHDNNRDAYALNLVESQYMAKIVYRDLCPQVYVDHHQMGSYGARFFLSPEMDPIYSEVDPLVWRETQFLGMFAAARLEKEGISGVETGAPFTPDFISAFQTLVYTMNIVGILTESASVRVATPIYVDPHQLRGYGRGRLSDKPYMNYPNPWRGGWWRLSDIVRQQLLSTIAILSAVAKFKRELLRNMYVKALRNIERGSSEPPYALVVPKEQHDFLTALKLIDTLLKLGVKVYEAVGPVRVGTTSYTSEAFVIPLSQPRRALVKKLLDRFFYPDDETTRDREGRPLRPYDIATDTLAEFMGVSVVRVDEPLSANLRPVTEVVRPTVSLGDFKLYVLDPRLNDSYYVVNKVLSSGGEVYRVFDYLSAGGLRIPPGAFIIRRTGSVVSTLSKVVSERAVPVYGFDEMPQVKIAKVEFRKVGVYERYYGGNMEAGWVKYVLDNYGFPYVELGDEPIKTGRLGEIVDAVIFPSDPLPFLTGENIEEELAKRWGRPVKLPPYPPEYRSGFGKEGIEKLKNFVESGGTVLVMGESVELLIKGFNLPLRDLTEEVKDPKQFFCPGSTLKILVDVGHPLGFGMPRQALALFLDRPVLEVIPSHMNEKFKVVARFPERDILQSGWLIGESFLGRKPALIDVEVGKGRAIAYSYRPIFRAQTHGTFKTLFNALYKYYEEK
ncbi:MAG: M14 family metallopeptidase [Sulfolobales archaeon]|nr:M14 family metallopeptidase [Sulfolobales archaeon]MCX8209140.1 M14 family metallopeptidase [Sulfolobales archaeon]MDW8010475.1 M14 family metallopeptidase [Sulfolobales archaeon]